MDRKLVDGLERTLGNNCTSTRSSRREHIMKITRSIGLAAMAAGACFGTGNAFAQGEPVSCITSTHGSTTIGTQGTPCTITDEMKVFLVAATAHTSTGTIGANVPGPAGLDFTSGNTVRFDNGFATIHPIAMGPAESFPNLHISAVDSEHFTDLTFDVQMANLAATNLVVSTTDGTEAAGSFDFIGLQHNTDLRFDILNPGGLTAVDLSTTSPSGIHEVKHLEVSGFTGAVGVPEPSTFALMVLGVLGVGLAGYRRSRRTRLERDFLWHGNASGADELPGAIA
jgi:hypothetical protein